MIDNYLQLIQERSFGWNTRIENPGSDKLVIMSHGWKSGPRGLNFLAISLANAGYSIYRLNLSTTFGRVSKILAEVGHQVSRIGYGEQFSEVNVIGHSFGGIIMKIMLNKYEFPNGNKFVTVGSPWGSTPKAQEIERKLSFSDDPGLFGNGIGFAL